MKSSNGLSVLFVCSGNFSNVAPFVTEQQQGLQSRGVTVNLYKIVGKGIGGYLGNLDSLKKELQQQHYDLVHAHFGLSGLLACLQGKVPVVITLHGSDLFVRKNKLYSKLANLLSKKTIVVNKKMIPLLVKKDFALIPCGIDTDLFRPFPKSEARNQLKELGKYQFEEGKIYVLFSSSFSKPVKNPELAQAAVNKLGSSYQLVELKNFTRKEVALLMNACDVALLTSHSEGSPQFIKEAMACNTPIVSTNVGDVSELFEGIEGCILVESTFDAVGAGLVKALQFHGIESRNRIIENYEHQHVITQLIKVYKEIVSKANKH